MCSKAKFIAYTSSYSYWSVKIAGGYSYGSVKVARGYSCGHVYGSIILTKCCSYVSVKIDWGYLYAWGIGVSATVVMVLYPTSLWQIKKF